MVERKRTEADADELTHLRARVAELERALAARKGETEGSTLVEINQQLVARVAELEERLRKVEEENRDFANLYVQAQEQSEAVTNLYVASHRLHATLDPREVMKIITEILVELVGAEEFGILLLNPKRKILQLVAGEGVRERLPSESLPADAGVAGEVTASGEPFFFEPKTPRERESGLPLAAVPLNMNGHAVGVIVIYKLLSHKRGFSSIDRELLQLLAADAVTALVSARLHSVMDRKLKTMEGFIQMMKSP